MEATCSECGITISELKETLGDATELLCGDPPLPLSVCAEEDPDCKHPDPKCPACAYGV